MTSLWATTANSDPIADLLAAKEKHDKEPIRVCGPHVVHPQAIGKGWTICANCSTSVFA